MKMICVNCGKNMTDKYCYVVGIHFNRSSKIKKYDKLQFGKYWDYVKKYNEINICIECMLDSMIKSDKYIKS